MRVRDIEREREREREREERREKREERERERENERDNERTASHLTEFNFAEKNNIMEGLHLTSGH